jgi:hypothetical protein
MEELVVGYSTLDDVKSQLRQQGFGSDAEVQKAIDDYDKAYIDVALTPYESSLPLAVVPDAIKTISKFGAAGLLLKMNPVSDIDYRLADAYLNIAKSLIEAYVLNTYFQGGIS